MSIGILLLAAGESRRFGATDKLLATLHGRPLITIVLNLLTRPGIAHRLTVVSSPDVEAVARNAGFDVVTLPKGQPQSCSLIKGVTWLRDKGVSRILIALGDMPFLNGEDIDRLLAFPADKPACFTLNGNPMPPAVFPSAWFDHLLQITGDRGAGTLLRDLPESCRLSLPAERLRDIDRPHDLHAVP